MITLPQAQVLSIDPLQAGIIRSTYLYNPLLQIVPFQNIVGGAYPYNRENGLAAGDTTRALNADYAEGTASFTRVTATLGRLGGLARVDSFVEATQSSVNDQLAVQVDAKSKAMSFAFQNLFFNGDTGTDANSFDGLSKLVTAASRTDTAATVLSLADLDALMLKVTQANALFVNDATLLKIQNLARVNNLLLPTIDMVGNAVTMYNGVKILRAGAYGGSNILADGEIYSVRFGADGVFGIQNSAPSAKVFEPNSERPAYTCRIDWYTAIAVGATDSVYKMKRALV